MRCRHPATRPPPAIYEESNARASHLVCPLAQHPDEEKSAAPALTMSVTTPRSCEFLAAK